MANRGRWQMRRPKAYNIRGTLKTKLTVVLWPDGEIDIKSRGNLIGGDYAFLTAKGIAKLCALLVAKKRGAK